MHRWLLWTLLAVVCWGVWALLGKLVGDSISPALTQALSTIGLAPVMVMLGLSIRLKNIRSEPLALEQARSRPISVRFAGPLFAFVAGILTCLGNVSYYTVLNSGAKAATVVPLTALYPFVTILLAMLLLRERLNLLQLSGLGLSLVAIYLFNVQQEQGLVSSWLLVALIPVVLWGIAGLLQKLTTNHCSSELSTLWFLSAFVPVAAWIVLAKGFPPPLTAGTWVIVTALGLTFALGNFGLLAAFANNGKASIITPLAGLYPIVSIPIAIVLLHERISWREGVGILLALVSIAALSYESPEAKPKIAQLHATQK